MENHTYSSAGTYTVTLSVTDATGQSSSRYQVSISVS
ncbi:MAG: PKD domain-containing protein [Chloroflexota bacterium]|nr:PKD domain-containing protein [Chloroflexota bacterium]